MTHVLGRPSLPGGDVGGEEPHVHPVPRRVNAFLLAHSLALALAFGFGGFWVHDQRQEDQRQVAAVAAELDRRTEAIAADIERRKAERDASDARDREGTRHAVCTFLADLDGPSDSTRALARQLRCGLPALVSPSPSAADRRAAVPPVAAETAGSPRASPSPSRPAAPTPRPTPAARPSNPASPSRRPSPSPTCLLPLPGPCLPR